MTTRTRPIPPHGERARYLRGCRCSSCSKAHYRYMSRYRLDRERGTHRRVPGAPARKHAQALYDAGWTTSQIADAAGCLQTTVSRLLRGCHKTIRADIATRILAAKPTIAACSPTTFVPAVGTVRRVQALMSIGYTLNSIAQDVGMYRTALGNVLNGKRATVTVATAVAMARVYSRRSKTSGPSLRARLYAARQGWSGPLAWDAASIDDPKARPETDTTQAPESIRDIAAARADEIKHLGRFGVAEEEIARRVGVTVGYVHGQLLGYRVPASRRQQLEEAA